MHTTCRLESYASACCCHDSFQSDFDDQCRLPHVNKRGSPLAAREAVSWLENNPVSQTAVLFEDIAAYTSRS